MNISKRHQRVLHLLALGGAIRLDRDAAGRIERVFCITREGLLLDGFAPADFAALRRKGLIASMGGQPYRITLLGRRVVRAQADNQGVRV